jgi:hypothetical protein
MRQLEVVMCTWKMRKMIQICKRPYINHVRSFNFSRRPVHGMRGVVALVQEVAQD